MASRRRPLTAASRGRRALASSIDGALLLGLALGSMAVSRRRRDGDGNPAPVEAGGESTDEGGHPNGSAAPVEAASESTDDGGDRRDPRGRRGRERITRRERPPEGPGGACRSSERADGGGRAPQRDLCGCRGPERGSAGGADGSSAEASGSDADRRRRPDDRGAGGLRAQSGFPAHRPQRAGRRERGQDRARAGDGANALGACASAGLVGGRSLAEWPSRAGEAHTDRGGPATDRGRVPGRRRR